MAKRIIGWARQFFFHQAELRRFQKLKSEQRDIVFYSESGAYWSYLGPFIEHLTRDHGRDVCYVTSSDDDQIFKSPPSGVKAFSIGDGTARTLFFASLDANLLVTSLLDLGTFHVKRSMNAAVHYVFVPHNMVSTHMVFRKGAFDSFDTVFCVGPHHVAEIREAEQLYNLPAKALVENGYVRLDTIHKEAPKITSSGITGHLKIVIAPSWGPNRLLETGAEPLIENLLNAEHDVTVRPHWETLRRAGPALDNLDAQFGYSDKFRLLREKSSNKILYEADLLVSDWSGAAFSYAFGLERPVMFIDVPKKINNPDYGDFKNIPIEITLREELGAVLSPDDYGNAALVAQRLCNEVEVYAEKISALRSKVVFNFGNSAETGARYLAELADKNRHSKSEKSNS